MSCNRCFNEQMRACDNGVTHADAMYANCFDRTHPRRKKCGCDCGCGCGCACKKAEAAQAAEAACEAAAAAEAACSSTDNNGCGCGCCGCCGVANCCSQPVACEPIPIGCEAETVYRVCCDPNGCCYKYPCRCRDPFWPEFAHPRWLCCADLYCKGCSATCDCGE